jgi:hypothetical protein
VRVFGTVSSSPAAWRGAVAAQPVNRMAHSAVLKVFN